MSTHRPTFLARRNAASTSAWVVRPTDTAVPMSVQRGLTTTGSPICCAAGQARAGSVVATCGATGTPWRYSSPVEAVLSEVSSTAVRRVEPIRFVRTCSAPSPSCM